MLANSEFVVMLRQTKDIDSVVELYGLSEPQRKYLLLAQPGEGIGKAVLHILRDAGGVGVVLSESLPTCVQEIGAQRIAQQQIDFIKVYPCGGLGVVAFVALENIYKPLMESHYTAPCPTIKDFGWH